MAQLTTTNQLTQDGKDTLESMLDSTSMSYLLHVIGQLCYEKSEHIRSNWQDGQMADAWSTAGDKLWRLADSSQITRIS